MRITYGYNARRFHHVIFRCVNDGIREPFWLTVAEMRAWHNEGDRLRRFISRGGCIKAHWPAGNAIRDYLAVYGEKTS